VVIFGRNQCNIYAFESIKFCEPSIPTKEIYLLRDHLTIIISDSLDDINVSILEI
jgi:hypothetical protein